jgi:hypothetical protein
MKVAVPGERIPGKIEMGVDDKVRGKALWHRRESLRIGYGKDAVVQSQW